MKAIETVYNGYKFRSRLEARWAVFFDAMGVEYQYEPEGFDFDGVWYLPDFRLIESDCYVEIKPPINRKSYNNLKTSPEKWIREHLGFSSAVNKRFTVFFGEPYHKEFDILTSVKVEENNWTMLFWRYASMLVFENQLVFCVEPKGQNGEVYILPFCELSEACPISGAILPMPAFEAARQARFEHQAG